MAKSNAKTDFMSLMKQSEEDFVKGRDSERRGGGLVHVTVGNHIVRIQSVELGVTKGDKQDIPYVQFNTICVHSEDEGNVGQRVSHRIQIVSRSGTKNGKDWSITKADCFNQVCEILEKFGIDTDDLNLSDLAKVGDELAEDQTACRIKVMEKGDYLNVRFLKQIEDDEDIPAISDVVEDDDSEDSGDEGEEEDYVPDDDDSEASDDDEGEEDDEDEEEDYVPAKGDHVNAKPKGAKKVEECIVVSVNKTKELCTLKRVRDMETFKDQSFSVIAGKID